MTVGERIKQRREELGLSQGELAKKMGYDNRQTVSKAERHGDNITTTKVMKYAKALDVSFEWLMGWEQDQVDENLRKTVLFTAYIKQLNDEGLTEALKRVEELTYLPKYRKDTDEKP